MSFETFVETAGPTMLVCLRRECRSRPLASRRQAFAWHARVAADEQGWCKADLDELDALVSLSNEPRREHAE
jgi:hypothetical protein